MGTGRIYQNWGDELDQVANAPSAITNVTLGTWQFGAMGIRHRVRDFDAATPEVTYSQIWLPSNYASGGTWNFTWYTTGTTGAAVFTFDWVLVHPSSEGSPTDIDVVNCNNQAFSSGITVPSTAGRVVNTSVDLSLSGTHAGDRLLVLWGRYASHGSDTLTVDLRWMEPWYFSFTTT